MTIKQAANASTGGISASAAASSGGGGGAATVNTILPDDNILAVGAIYSSTARQNIYSSGEWSSGGPNSTYYNNLQDANSITQAWNMLMGDGKPQSPDGTSSYYFYTADKGDQFHRELRFAHNRRLGHVYRDYYYKDNASTNNTYAGCTWSCMPIRNSGSSAANCVIQTTRSTGSNNYGGSACIYYTPTGATYAATTAGAWTTLNNSASNSMAYNYEATIPVPAGTTVLVMMTSAHYYHTTYRFKDTHTYADLHTAFVGDIKCDLRMLHTLHMGRQPASIYNASTPYEIYTTCASLYGDR